MQIAIVTLPVSDQQAAKAFYVEKLGFSVAQENPMGPDQTWVQLAPPGGGTNVTLVTWFDTMPVGGQKGLVIETGDIAATRDVLVANGVEVGAIDAAPWGKFATFEDPDGNGWVLTEPEADSRVT